jgi:hypothetical protein
MTHHSSHLSGNAIPKSCAQDQKMQELSDRNKRLRESNDDDPMA